MTVLAPTPAVLIGARILQSVGGCAGLVLGRAAVRDGATADKAAGQLALLTLVMSMVPAIAPAIGGFITAWYGWRASFVLLSIIGGLTSSRLRPAPSGNAGALRRQPVPGQRLRAVAPITPVPRLCHRRGLLHDGVLRLHVRIAFHI